MYRPTYGFRFNPIACPRTQNLRSVQTLVCWRDIMKKLTVIGAILLGAAILSVSPVSLNWSSSQGVSVSQDQAYAVIGRPGTPGSVAGVARRQTRRAIRRGYGY